MANSPVSQALFACGKPLDSSETAFGWLRESLPSEAGLAERLHEDGYLYLRGLIPSELISTVREQVLGELRDRGLLEGEDTVREGAKISAFQPELVEQNLDVTRVMFGEELHSMMKQLHGEPVMHYQYVWFRSLGEEWARPRIGTWSIWGGEPTVSSLLGCPLGSWIRCWAV